MVFALDQVTKIVIRKTMVLYESKQVLGNFLKLTYVENRGMAFGINFEYMHWITILSVLLTGLSIVYLIHIRNERYLQPYGIAMIVGGAFGNLTDRIFRKEVTDFIDVGIPNFFSDRWWIFNISDVAITIGIAFFLISSYTLEREAAKKTKIKSI